MRKIPQFLFRCSLVAFAPIAANAAGTYYTGNYQSPQNRYNSPSYAQQRSGGVTAAQTAGYNRSGYSANGYSSYSSTRTTRTAQQPAQSSQSSAKRASSSAKKGFSLDAGISRETAMWQFEMKESNSILHYDNINWNVFDAAGKYVFNAGNTAMEVSAGLKYGFQSGDSTMVDDDVTNGGYFITQWVNSADNSVIGDQIGHALSIGSSKDGSMLGFNAGFGLTDFFKWGNMKITPSVGYRYLKYKLETKKNYGLSVDTSACFEVGGEIQCDPAVVIHYSDGKQQIIWRDDIKSEMEIGSGASNIDTGGTYYYQQPGTSHSYEVEWSGPYLAMDMVYDINQNNSVNGRVELGFPGYKSTGDQPYRFDWAHPKSVEDKAGMFGAIHFGLGANWLTAITDTISLSIGLTYDYYTVSDADAKTYLNPTYYDGLYNTRLQLWESEGKTEADMLATDGGDAIAKNIKQLEQDCPGWVCSTNGEIESFYKSMGIRVGINAKF